MSPHLPETPEPSAAALGAHLKAARTAVGLTLRAVEERTGRAVTNGYLSQIESGAIAKPSPNVLYHLAQTYDLDYGDLLTRAGHRVPADAGAPKGVVAGFPMNAVAELTAEERAQLLDYIAYLRSRRSR